jgi:hypothetical protein
MTVAASLFVLPRAMTFDGNGHAQGGALLGFYQTGTTTPQTVYADSGLTTPLSNPVVADANGLFPAIYMPANTLYQAVLQTAALATVWTTDPIEGIALSTAPAVGLLVNYLSGLNTSRNAGTPNTKIDVTSGACTDSTNALAMIVAAGTIDCGNVGANGLDTGILAPSTWYFPYVIAKVDGTTALLMSASASSPTLPSGYTLFRRIWDVKTDGSAHFVPYTQTGDLGQWITETRDSTNNTTTGNKVVNVPPGFPVVWQGRVINSTDSTSLDIVTPGVTSVNGSGVVGGSNVPVAASALTDASQHVLATNFSGSPTFDLYTTGWLDRRGRDGP